METDGGELLEAPEFVNIGRRDTNPNYWGIFLFGANEASYLYAFRKYEISIIVLM
jgi:hypothetical protein